MDLFPHTKHCELVILFERVKPEDEEAGNREEDRSGSGTGFEMPMSGNPEVSAEVPVAEEEDGSSDRRVVGESSEQCFGETGSTGESGLNSKTEKSTDAQNSSGGTVDEK